MSRKTDYTNRFDVAGMWSSLPTYFVVWCIVASWNAQSQLLWFSVPLAAVYVLMHLYEIKWRHHCFLSADSTAGPGALLAFVGLAVYGYKQELLSGALLVDFAIGSLVAFFVGHIAALAVAGVFHLAGEAAWKTFGRNRDG